MIVYKLVYPFYYNFKSPVVFGSWLSTNYKIGEFVTAPKEAAKKGYYLTAFRTYEDALKLVKKDIVIFKFKIYKAEGQEQILPLPPICDIYKLVYCREFLPEVGHTWPEGTVMFKKIKLLEEVKYE